MRRDYSLGEADETVLSGVGLPWDLISEPPSRWVIVRGLEVPAGYTVDRADVAIQIATNYPVEALDMAYLFPALKRSDGKGIHCADSTQAIEGKTYQRWSRHYTPANPWVPGEHNIGTHFTLVKLWVTHELAR